MSQSEQIIEIFKSRTNLLKQLKEQGYNVEDYEGSNIAEVNSMFIEKQLDMLVTNKKKNQKTYIKYHLESGKSKSLRSNHIQECIDDLMGAENILEKKIILLLLLKMSQMNH